MKQNERKKWSREFKLEAVRQTQVTGRCVAEVARALEIPVHQLYRWRTEVDHKETEAFPGSGHETPNAELETLRRENKRLREEWHGDVDAKCQISANNFPPQRSKRCMPRAPRLQFPGAFYHAYHRGNRRERIFYDDQDYARFEVILIEAMNWSGVQLYTWKLMPNHFHLAAETPEGNLAEFMQRLLGRFAMYFNGRHGLVGHVFQGRYGARVCDKEAYFLELIRYIQLNAYRIKGKPLAALGQWRWSSHRYHIGWEKPPEGTTAAFQEVSDRFGKTPEQARTNYAKFLADGLDIGNWKDFYRVKSDHFVGNEPFIEKIKRQTGQTTRLFPRSLRRLSRIEDLAAIAEDLGGPDRETLASDSREAGLNRWRQALAYVGRRFYRFRVLEIGRVLGRDRTSSAICYAAHGIKKT